MTTQVAPSMLANSGYELGMRNRIINGGFRIGQRGTSFTLTGAAGPSFVVDRWFTSQLGAGVNDEIVSLIADSEGTSQYALRINQYKASGFSGGNSRLIQIIESDATADLAGQICTLSFKHACGTGIPFSGAWGVYVRYDTNDSTLNSAAASSTTFETIGTGITSAVFRSAGLATTTYTKTTLSFTVPVGVKRIAVVLFAGNSTSNAVLDIKEVQLEKGAIATPFEFRPYGFELAQCQRYYEVVGGTVSTTMPIYFPRSYKVAKRATPTLTLVTGSAGGATFDVGPDSGASFRLPAGTVASSTVDFTISSSAEL